MITNINNYLLNSIKDDLRGKQIFKIKVGYTCLAWTVSKVTLFITVCNFQVDE